MSRNENQPVRQLSNYENNLNLNRNNSNLALEPQEILRVLFIAKVLLHRKSYSHPFKWRTKYIVITSDGLLHSFPSIPVDLATDEPLVIDSTFTPKCKAPTILPICQCSIAYFKEEKILFLTKYKLKIQDNVSCEKLVFFISDQEEASHFQREFIPISNTPSPKYKLIRKNSISHQIQAHCSVRVSLQAS
jgi:hypothetical protein